MRARISAGRIEIGMSMLWRVNKERMKRFAALMSWLTVARAAARALGVRMAYWNWSSSHPRRENMSESAGNAWVLLDTRSLGLGISQSRHTYRMRSYVS